MSLNYDRFLTLNESNYDACFFRPAKGKDQPKTMKGGKGGALPKCGYTGAEKNIFYRDFTEIIGKQPVVRSQTEERPVRPLVKKANFLDKQFDCMQPFWGEKCL
mgnify:FL=1|jgi:hypothetical protein